MAEKKKNSGTEAKALSSNASAGKAPVRKAPAKTEPAGKKSAGKMTTSTKQAGKDRRKKTLAKTRKQGRLSGQMLAVMGSNNAMIAAKGTVVAAAMLSLLLLIIAGADLRPSAVIQGAKNKYAFSQASGDGFPVEIPGGKILDVSEVTKGTAVLTSTRCTVYDAKGREVSTVNHMLSSPSMDSAEGYILLYNRLGRDYLLRTLSGTSCKGEMDASIICADVSASGVFAFVTTSDTNNARLAVCSPDGKTIHKWKSVNYKISDVAISPSGQYIALCGFSTQKGALVSTVIIQKVGGRENMKEVAVEGTLIVDIEFSGNSSVVAVGEDLAAYVSVKNDEKTIYGYKDRMLNCYDLSEDGDLALVFSEHSDGRNASVVVIDDKGHEKASIATSMTSPYVDLAHGRINLLYQTEVTSYNYQGKLLRHSEVQADCQTIFTSGGRLLGRGVMYLNDIR